MLSVQTSPKRTFKKLCVLAHTCNLSTQAVGIGKSLGIAGPKQQTPTYLKSCLRKTKWMAPRGPKIDLTSA